MNYLKEEQPLIFHTINHSIDNERLSHALIFYGDQNTSKKEMAIYLVKKLYAKFYNTLVGDSPVDHLIDVDSFSNLFLIKPEKKNTTKKQIDEILNEASKSNLNDGPKVFIFLEAETIDTIMSNKLLKFIEEPLDDIYIIFIYNSLDSVLDTIKSRCSLFSFIPLNKELVLKRLDSLNYDKELINIIKEYSLNIDEIKSILEDESMIRVVDFVKEIFNVRYEKKDSIVLYLKENIDIINNDKKFDLFISLLIVYFKDIYKVMINDDELIFKDEKERITELASFYTKDSIETILKQIIEIKQNLKFPINKELSLASLMLDIEFLKRG